MDALRPAPRRRKPRALVPREHGAWAQMALPLVSALLVGGASASALLLTAATVLGFVAHEPALVLLGARGTRVRAEEGGRARRLLAVLLGLASAGGLAGFVLSSWPARVALLLASVAALVVMALAVARRERSMPGEFTVVTAFVSAGAAVSLAAGTTLAVAATQALTWWLAFGASIFAVHAVLARGTLKGARHHGVWNAGLVVVLAGGGSLAALHFGLGLVVPAAISPMVLLSLLVCVARFSGKDLPRLGWGLAGASMATLGLLVLGVRYG